MSQALNIGLLSPGWPGTKTPNGIATAVFHLATGLKEIGHKPVILTDNIDAEGPGDIPVIPVTPAPWRLHELVRAKLGDTSIVHQVIARGIANAARKGVREHGLDVLILEETNGWAGMVQAQVRVPIVTTLHGPWKILAQGMHGTPSREDRRRQAREARAFQMVKGLIAPSAITLKAIDGLAGCAKTPQAIIPNAFDPGPEPSGRDPASLARLLFVGRFDRLKGADTLLEAFTDVSARHPQAGLTLVGRDTGISQKDGSRLKSSAALAELPPAVARQITVMGPLERQEVAAARARHPIAVIASRFEVFGYTLLEAMAAGQGIVCTDAGGPAEILEHEKTALLVPPADPAAMADALTRLIADPSLAKNLGEAARARVISDFAPPVIAVKTAEFIKKALG